MAELDLLGEAASRERRHRDAVGDPLFGGRRHELEGDRRGEQPRLGDERLCRPGDRAEPAEAEPLLRGEAAREPRQRRLQQLERALGGGRQRRRERDPREVERLASGSTS